MKLTKFDVYLNVWISLVISAILSFTLPLIANGHVTAGEYMSGLFISFVISFVLVLVIPVVKWGDLFAAKCGAVPHTASGQLLATIVLALVIGTFMSLIMTWWGVRNVPGFQNFFLSAWMNAYPWALLVIYVSANISLWTGIPLVKKLLGIQSG
ncbi:MAG: hypothetical protein LBG12_09510 [Synergistaceae bacterium]|jgi:hypothetical protein|nr:hypothetical protein [Synergistaceae bacterium]